MAVHPGSFVRGMRPIPDDEDDRADPVGFDAYDLVYGACQDLARAAAVSTGRAIC